MIIPISETAPDNILDRVHEFSKDMAIAVVNQWCSGFYYMFPNNYKGVEIPYIGEWGVGSLSDESIVDRPAGHLRNKWNADNIPSPDLLVQFGYFELSNSSTVSHPYPDETTISLRLPASGYVLTQKAYKLLEQPPSAPNTFISYRRGYSTPFALYLEARLRLAGNNAVYLDKMLELGGRWREELETKIRESKYLIVLCSQKTFDSDWVKKEIAIAQDAGCIIIPVLHPADREEFRNREIPSMLDGIHTTKVNDISALGYETAANEVLNRMGYSTY